MGCLGMSGTLYALSSHGHTRRYSYHPQFLILRNLPRVSQLISRSSIQIWASLIPLLTSRLYKRYAKKKCPTHTRSLITVITFLSSYFIILSWAVSHPGGTTSGAQTRRDSRRLKSKRLNAKFLINNLQRKQKASPSSNT